MHFGVIRYRMSFSQTVLHSGYERGTDLVHVYKPLVGAALADCLCQIRIFTSSCMITVMACFTYVLFLTVVGVIFLPVYNYLVFLQLNIIHILWYGNIFIQYIFNSCKDVICSVVYHLSSFCLESIILFLTYLICLCFTVFFVLQEEES